ncbi:MAG: glycosyltransferase family 2 protein [Lachnospiraceae bacterium]|nr:glycosyltransferase family 2 protein [Lachnospiraceae bacterium]
MITISLCMIVKNEEKTLDRCLSCVAELMDEIIVVDTGSTDRTKEVAARYTDRIYDFDWVDDFSAARNYAFSKATGDYIYSADADEFLDEENRVRFRLLKENMYPEIEVVQMYYCNQLKFATVYNYDKEYRPKLFKRVRSFTWIDPIHETVRTDPLVFDSDIEIIHEQEGSHAKRDILAFQRICRREGGLSARLHSLYARELFIAGEKEDFLEAESFFDRTCEEADRTPEEVKEALCVTARAARLRGDDKKFYRQAMKAAACQSCGEICLELGDYYMQEGDPQEAALWYYNAAFETESILDIRCSGDKALLGLARCCRLLGQEEQSQAYRGMAEEWRKENGYKDE